MAEHGTKIVSGMELIALAGKPYRLGF